MRVFRSLVSGVFLTLTMGLSQVHAHDPAEHGFALRVFEKSYGAPDFALNDRTGQQVTLGDYRGQYLLLVFWKTACQACIEQLPSLNALSQRYAGHGLAVVAIASEATENADAEAVLEAQSVSFDALFDSTASTATAYGAKKIPVAFLINRGSRIVGFAVGKRDWASDAAFSVFDELTAAP